MSDRWLTHGHVVLDESDFGRHVLPSGNLLERHFLVHEVQLLGAGLEDESRAGERDPLNRELAAVERSLKSVREQTDGPLAHTL